ncbi:MAG: DUF3887 domain-containing protein [Rhodanobacteraceae bacterium]|nr:MAG: DUF3887 domain-containing protein [Rhodanobacteraceae bacterium]
MHRSLLAVALVGALPAFATARPPSPHPASSVQAAAVAGQVNAARMEACTHRSDALLDALGKANYSAATAHFDRDMKTRLDAAKLRTAWLGVGAQVGALKARGTPRSFLYQGFSVVATPLQFARGQLTAQVACNGAGQVAGFYIRPRNPGAAG